MLQARWTCQVRSHLRGVAANLGHGCHARGDRTTLLNDSSQRLLLEVYCALAGLWRVADKRHVWVLPL
jgi:hypothetical protein